MLSRGSVSFATKVIAAVALCVWEVGCADGAAQMPDEGRRGSVDLLPPLLEQAEAAGLWSSDELLLDAHMNPYYLRGDWDGDGSNDIAAWVRLAADGRRGLLIVHATLDTLHLFGAGEPLPSTLRGVAGFAEDALRVDAWRVLPVGHVEQGPYTTDDQVGVTAGREFRFERETLELVYTGKSAFALYWSSGGYHVIWTAD